MCRLTLPRWAEQVPHATVCQARSSRGVSEQWTHRSEQVPHATAWQAGSNLVVGAVSISVRRSRERRCNVCLDGSSIQLARANRIARRGISLKSVRMGSVRRDMSPGPFPFFSLNYTVIAVGEGPTAPCRGSPPRGPRACPGPLLVAEGVHGGAVGLRGGIIIAPSSTRGVGDEELGVSVSDVAF